MSHKSILILGGYGNTGKLIAHLLLQETEVDLLLAGRHIEIGKRTADNLNHSFSGNRVKAIFTDASDVDSLRAAFKGQSLVVVASSTSQYTHQIITTALEVGIDYLDIQYSSQKYRLLQSMAAEIKNHGRCFITEAGFHPGLPAFLVRYVAAKFDRLEVARVGSVIKVDWKNLEVAESTIHELMDEFNDFEMSTFKNGQWKKVGLFNTSDYIRMDFNEQFSRQYCAPMMLEEMRALPDMYPSIKETGFFVGSFNWFVDWVIMPMALMALKLWPKKAIRPMSRWMHWGLNTFSKPPYATMLKVEAEGEKDGKYRKESIIISHPDGYWFTAIPVTACLLQYLDGSIAVPGLWMQPRVVEPSRFMEDLLRMGISIKIE